MVWDGRLPSYFERIICQCGRDNSRDPPDEWRVRYAEQRYRSFAQAYGQDRAQHEMESGRLHQLPRERDLNPPEPLFGDRWDGYDPAEYVGTAQGAPNDRIGAIFNKET